MSFWMRRRKSRWRGMEVWKQPAESSRWLLLKVWCLAGWTFTYLTLINKEKVMVDVVLQVFGHQHVDLVLRRLIDCHRPQTITGGIFLSQTAYLSFSGKQILWSLNKWCDRVSLNGLELKGFLLDLILSQDIRTKSSVVKNISLDVSSGILL